MQLIETYALSCGLKISKPFIYQQFYPTPWDEFVLLHAGGAMPAKRYDYYTEVIEILRPLIGSLPIIQIGGADEKYIPGCVNLLGMTTLSQSAYLIKRAKLLIGNDSCNVHIASGFNTPVVSLYGPTTPYNHGPSFSSNFICLSADLNGDKPSYSAEEAIKTINTIKPESVAAASLKLLGMDAKLLTRETVHIGHQYNHEMIEVIPNSIIPPDFFPNATPTIRMDYEFNEEVLAHNLSLRPYRIITDRAISPEILRRFKPRIASIVYDIPKDFDVDFVANVQRSGIDFTLVSLLKGADLADAKMAMFDFGLVLERHRPGEEFMKKNEGKLSADLKYKTNKIILSNSKLYLNRYNQLRDISSESINNRCGAIALDDTFFDFAENLYIYKE